MKNNKYNVSTIINYCTNDYKFISHCINEAKIFSEQVIVPVCDHFLDGTPENRILLEKTYIENPPNTIFHEYKYDHKVFSELKYNAVHGLSRLLGFNKTNDNIDYILFIDADEIIEGGRFKQFLNMADFKKYNAILFANYYYFRDVKFRAKKLEASILFVKKSVLAPDIILQEHDRSGIFKLTPGEKIKGVVGLDNKPLAHHYSWVRTKEEMIKKVKTFGHKSDRDWVSLVEKEFSHEFNGKDFVSGYEYETVEPYISIDINNHKANSEIQRSFIIPVLDFSPHSPYNIKTLLNDLENTPGEVICVFNSKEVYEELRSHPRINKYCYNNLNAGVPRSWNIGINLAEGKAVFIINSDVHISPSAIEQLESYLFSLDKAVIIGPQGGHIDFKKLSIIRYFEKKTFDGPVQTHDVSGFLFAIHRERFLNHHLMFDVQFSPCFFEEWDMGLQVMQAGLACYAVPVDDFEHKWGASQDANLSVNYFGREMNRNDILSKNRERFMAKWHKIIFSDK